MKTHPLNRRKFIRDTSAGAAATVLAGSVPLFGQAGAGNASKLAIRGGTPVRASGWQQWPVWDRNAEETMVRVLRSGNWYRGDGAMCDQFEKKYAELIGARRALATASGTTALITAMQVLGVDAGDEVIISPYTFIATYNVVFNARALPVFADTDPETFLIDPSTIEQRINERTSAIMPVHIFGLPADMNRINHIAGKHSLPVIEDACQAWLAEHEGKSCGTLGDLGCFSFQASKHIPSGEGGAVVGNDDALMDRCHAYHNCGRPYGESMKGMGNHCIRGSNKRMTEMQAVILLSQLERVKADTGKRIENARYLDSRLKDIPGIVPYKLEKGATRAVYHLYPFRYQKEHFDGLSRDQFRAALNAEGIPNYSAYGKQYFDGLMEDALGSRGYKRLYSEQRLKQYREELHHLPGNDQLTEEALTFFQHMLLAEKEDMDHIADAIQKIYENRKQLI